MPTPTRILIADDEQEWRDILAGMLAKHFPEAEFVEAGTVAELEAAASQGPFHSVFKDCRLGADDRPLVLDRIKHLRNLVGDHCPIIVVSGDSKVVTDAMMVGANGGCVKARAGARLKDDLRAELARLNLIS